MTSRLSPNPTHAVRPLASAAGAGDEQVLPRVRDLAVRAVVGLEEVDPRRAQLLAAVAEVLGQRLRRAVAGREQLPVRLAGRRPEGREVALQLELERIAQQLADDRLVAPVER